ncbi:TPA: SIR2 family protein [Enterobacter roggenkampii]|nr:SIR2 family protein [Enterobacter roggenkampii]
MNKEFQKIRALSDYPSLKKISEALWQQDTTYHGAAILIGAGFSRSAAKTGDLNKKLPLWYDLSKILHEELQEELHDETIQDPLRLAEVYCAYFGRPALLELIKKNVNDQSWEPGELHKKLLSLPWTEIMTTNWDTLLERAATQIHSPIYNFVLKQSDLSNARSPRIAKLHGTIGVSEDLVFTQEDYRLYPANSAAFINFVRQVFIENELCLLGFSGDDPNFLQWAGWVRDHLSGKARRIYLVGSLNLSSAKRKYLESINVSPIDLYDLVKEYDDMDKRHHEAIRLFIEAIIELKGPQQWEWSPSHLYTRNELPNTSLEKAKFLEESLSILISDRLSYPNWIVCPRHESWLLQNQINFPYITPELINEIKEPFRVKIIYEIYWRAHVTGSIIEPSLSKEFLRVCDPFVPNALTKEQKLKIAFKLYADSCWHQDINYTNIKTAARKILDEYAPYWSETKNEILYTDALLSVKEFEYDIIDKLSKEINIQDPLWKMRKSLLLVEIGNFEEATDLIKAAHAQYLEYYKKDRKSIFILSRLAWCERLLKHELIDDGTFLFDTLDDTKIKCDSWGFTRELMDETEKYVEKQKKQASVELMFEAGYYRDNSKTITFTNALHPFVQIEHLIKTIGLPIRFKSSNILSGIIEKLLQCDELSNKEKFSLSIRAANSGEAESLKYFFSRASVAMLPSDEINVFIDKCIQSIHYWTGKLSSGISYARSKLQVFIEVLARLSVRADEEQAKQIFHLACRLVKNKEYFHVWLHEPLHHLVQYSLESISNEKKKDLLIDILDFPLAVEIGAERFLRWPNPIPEVIGDRDCFESTTKRISKIIDTLIFNSSANSDALIRLLPLIRNGFLRDDELKRIKEKLWAGNDYTFLPETGLLKFTLIELAYDEKVNIEKTVRNFLYEKIDSHLYDYGFLSELVNAALSDVKLKPTHIQAAKIFDKLVAWERTGESDSKINLGGYDQKDLRDMIGKTLSRCIVPSLQLNELTTKNLEKIHDLYLREDSSDIILAFPFFSIDKDNASKIEKVIIKGLQSMDVRKVSSSAFAILKMTEFSESEITDRLITRLVYLACSNRDCGMVSVLWTINELVLKEKIKKKDMNSLADILPILFDSYNYYTKSKYKSDSNTDSLVRASCVKLAKNLFPHLNDSNKTEFEKMLEEARSDALPEVRFA